ncbi:MAG: PEGA domain-containing protein [Polyangiaceae bacterium]
MRQSISVLAALGALSLAAPAAAQTSPAPAASNDPERVRDLLTRGTEALSANRPEEARSLLSEAYGLRRSYDVAAALGQAELELGKHRDAAEHLDFSIREFPPGESRKLLKQLEDAFASARSRVATLRVSVNQPGCEVSVDGKPVGNSPLPSSLFVEPGQHTLGARVGAGSGVERVLSVAAGKEYPVELAMNPKAAATTPSEPSQPTEAPPPPAPAGSSDVSPKTIVLIGGGALTAVLLGVGVVERLRASSADDDAKDARAMLSGNCDPSDATPSCKQLIEHLDRRNSANRMAVTGFVGAGITAAATAAIWLLWDDTSSSPSASRLRHTARTHALAPRLSVSITPRDAGVSFATSF